MAIWRRFTEPTALFGEEGYIHGPPSPHFTVGLGSSPRSQARFVHHDDRPAPRQLQGGHPECRKSPAGSSTCVGSQRGGRALPCHVLTGAGEDCVSKGWISLPRAAGSNRPDCEQVDWRLIPALTILYLLAIIDRANIGMWCLWVDWGVVLAVMISTNQLRQCKDRGPRGQSQHDGNRLQRGRCRVLRLVHRLRSVPSRAGAVIAQ